MHAQNSQVDVVPQPLPSHFALDPGLPDIFDDGGKSIAKYMAGRARTAGEIAAEFLRQFSSTGSHLLRRIDPGKPQGENARSEAFPPGAWSDMAEWIDRYNGKENLYYLVNERSRSAQGTDATKEDIGLLRALYADFDPKGGAENFAAERKRLSALVDGLLAGPVPPSFVVDSGSGFQAVWRLAEPLDAQPHAANAEAVGKSIADTLGGDHVQDIPRVFRLPGTTNLPNAKKRAIGRTKRQASLYATSDSDWSLDQLAEAFPPDHSPKGGVEDRDAGVQAALDEIDMRAVAEHWYFEDLPEDLRERFDRLRAAEPDVARLWDDGRVPDRADGKPGDQTASGRRFALAAALRRGGRRQGISFTIDEYGALLWVWDRSVNPEEETALEDKITRREIARGWAHAETKGPLDLIEDLGPEPARPETAPLDAAGWPEPIDLFGNADPGELGDLPAGALPPMMTRLAKSEARRKGVPEAFAAASIVTAFGAAIGSGVRIQVRQRDDGWTEAGNLWTVLVAPPGSAKSPTIAAAVAPLRLVNDRWLARDTAVHAQWFAATRKRGKDAPPAGEEPRIRRTVVDDMTIEKAIRIFRDNPRGVLQAPDELAGLLGALGAYKKTGGSDRAHLLRMFDGGSITVDRVGSGTVSAKCAQLTVLAGTQPEKLQGLVRDLGTDGLLQRFLVILHDGRERPQRDEEPDREAAAWFAAAVERLTSAGDTQAAPVRVSGEAAAAMADATDRIMLLKHTPGATDALRGHIEKWGKMFPRLVLIVHVARMAEAGDGFDSGAAIDADTVAMAGLLARFFLRHALAFYSTYFGLSPAASEALWIAGFLLTRPDLQIVSQRNIYDARTSLRGAENLRARLAAMSELETAGWCAVKDRDSSGPKTWCVNPRIHSRFAEHAERERQERSLKRVKIAEASAAREWINSGAVSHTAREVDIFG